ncbi:MAG: imidazoleglycerol-phosphate dehydratase HisB [bacterium]
MRKATITRKTYETEISVELDIDGTERVYEIDTPVGFITHMLELLSRHGLFDLKVVAKGDVKVDDHHTVEDLGIALGQAFRKALGDRRGIRRYGTATLPMNEALCTVAVDLDDRPTLVFRADALKGGRVGTFDVELVREFWKAFVNNAGMTMHIHVICGENLHHIIESIFKAAARALDEATQIDERTPNAIPSTKGTL